MTLPQFATGIDTFIGSRLKKYRESASFSQSELANLIKVDEITLAKYELGAERCPAAVLFRASRTMSCQMVDFFEDFAIITPNLDEPKAA